MAEIFILDRSLRLNMGRDYNIGDKFYKEPYESVIGTNNYFGFDGGYAVWDRHIPMDEYGHVLENTNKPKEYFINKIYSQFQLDEILKQYV